MSNGDPWACMECGSDTCQHCYYEPKKPNPKWWNYYATGEESSDDSSVKGKP